MITTFSPMPTQVTAIKARHNLGELLDKIYYQKQQIVIMRKGKAMARLVPEADIQELVQILKIASLAVPLTPTK